MIKKLLPRLICWYVWLLRWTCRTGQVADPREQLRREGKNYIYASLHAQQIVMMVRSEPGAGAMVSRSRDGDLIARTLEKTGITPIRGSSGVGRKGGAAALLALVNHIRNGKPAFLAVDGPKGPRGRVSPGVALLSQKTGAPVLPLAFISTRRWVLKTAWDRTQLPLPFSTIVGRFGEPMYSREGESADAFAERIQRVLSELEAEVDPDESVYSIAPKDRQIPGDSSAAA
jgi:lysophospholipid acyltransferase (LPLAT)-like uncharacterized protein